MTIICAHHDLENNCTWVGCDTMAEDTFGGMTEVRTKFVVHGEWAIGVAGSRRMQDILSRERVSLFDDLNYTEDFVGRLIHVLKKHKIDLSPASGVSMPNCGHQFVLARAGHDPWVIGEDFCIISPGRFAAEGSGSSYALGAFYCSCDIEKAICAAVRYDSGCGGNGWIKKLERP